MADIVVTVPKWFWFDWILEGDAVGERETGEEWGFTCGWQRPPANPGDRCYIVAHDRLRGYAPVTRIAKDEDGRGYAIGRKGGAVAITIPERIVGFRGWRLRSWEREAEVPFPGWKTDDVAPQWFSKHALELLDEFYTPAEAKAWLRLPQKLLGGESATALIGRAEGAKVLALLYQLTDGAYV